MQLNAIRKHLPVLKRLANAKSAKSRVNIIKKCNASTIDALCSCALNATKGTLPLTLTQRKTLRKFKPIIKKLIRPKLHHSKKRKLLSQRGGFLGSVIAGLASLIPSLISAIKG